MWQWDIPREIPIGLAEAPLEFYQVAVEDNSIYLTDLEETFANE